MVPFFVNEALPKYPDWPLAPSPELNALLDKLDATEAREHELRLARDRTGAAAADRELKRLGVGAAELLFEHGLTEHRGWRVVSHLRVEVLAGAEESAAAWMAERGIRPARRQGQPARRELGREFERAGIELGQLRDDLFEWSVRWRVVRSR